jgi:predicted  nucleic acid-binding Zn-ribbon protein
LTATDSLHQKAAKGADKLAKVGKAAKRLQIQESALDGRKDARDAELAYAVGYLDESAAARSEVTLQLQKGKATIRQSTDAELIAFVEAGIDETDMDECMGNLMSYSARNGESTQPLNLLEGIF